jgi:hypothetical protein
LYAADPMPLMAMVKHDSAPRTQFHTVKERPVVGAPVSTSRQASRPVGEPKVSKEIIPVKPVGLEKQSILKRANPLLQTEQYLTEKGHKRWSNLEAGYGDIFCDKSPFIYGRNGTALEEPACGYLKVCFRF